ncbi:SAP18 family protein [Aspergillus lucknowensis]|uniref:Sin3 associated polypeptide p18-domain-containing protein n=1 Tax=Aspergillus lucknowensis TaxID=176173 RepID=A0ABR4LXK7_9EURO
MAARDVPKPKIDRQSTTPFHLKLFYRLQSFHNLSDFAIPPPSSSLHGGPVSGPNAIRSRSPPPPPPLPAHLQIYTWQSCTLRELSQLLTSALPSMLPDPPIGTRLCFRLIYPDTKAAAMLGPDARGRYISKDLGSVIIGPRESPYRDSKDEEVSRNGPPAPRTGPFRVQGNDAEKTLQDARFVIGDFVDCAILPPLEDGSVAPALTGGRGPMTAGGGGMRAFRDNGFGGGRGGRGRGGGDRGIPPGDWRRGERLPDSGRGGFGGGPGRRGWAPY